MTKQELAENLNVNVQAKNKVNYLVNKYSKRELEILTELYNDNVSMQELERKHNIMLYSEIERMSDDALTWNDFVYNLQLEDIYLTDKQYKDLFLNDMINAYEDDNFTIIDDRKLLKKDNLIVNESSDDFNTNDQVDTLEDEDSEEYSEEYNAKKTVSRVTLKQVHHQTTVPRMRINNPNIAAEISDTLENLPDLDRENLMLLFLNNKNEITGYSIETIGTIDMSIVSIRDIIKDTLIHNANKIMLLHNHPSGDTTPSESDIKSTVRVVEACNIMQIQLLDHVIVGRSDSGINTTSLRRYNSAIFN